MRAPEGDHLILFDGSCGFCNRLVRFVARRDADARFRFASLQGAAGRAALSQFGKLSASLDTFHVVGTHHSSAVLLSKARATLFVLARLPRPWRWLRVLAFVPMPLLDALYDFVARHRHRLFRRGEACPILTAEERPRFLDP